MAGILGPPPIQLTAPVIAVDPPGGSRGARHRKGLVFNLKHQPDRDGEGAAAFFDVPLAFTLAVVLGMNIALGLRRMTRLKNLLARGLYAVLILAFGMILYLTFSREGGCSRSRWPGGALRRGWEPATDVRESAPHLRAPRLTRLQGAAARDLLQVRDRRGYQDRRRYNLWYIPRNPPSRPSFCRLSSPRG